MPLASLLRKILSLRLPSERIIKNFFDLRNVECEFSPVNQHEPEAACLWPHPRFTNRICVQSSELGNRMGKNVRGQSKGGAIIDQIKDRPLGLRHPPVLTMYVVEMLRLVVRRGIPFLMTNHLSNQ
jgi:hypothetical protein